MFWGRTMMGRMPVASTAISAGVKTTFHATASAMLPDQYALGVKSPNRPMEVLSRAAPEMKYPAPEPAPAEPFV